VLASDFAWSGDFVKLLDKKKKKKKYIYIKKYKKKKNFEIFFILRGIFYKNQKKNS